LGKQFTLGRQERLKSRKLVEQLFNGGKSLNVFPFRVYYLLFKEGPPGTKPVVNVQCGFGVSSRQFKKAVDRNRVKRVTREAWRLQKQALTGRMAALPEHLALFLVYTGKDLPDFNTVKEKVAVILNKLITIVDEAGKIHP
jgi:ribonuclease P protein component